MFGFFIKKKLYNLVISFYIKNLYIYENEIDFIIKNLKEETTKNEMLNLNFQATQKYYSRVFDDVCQEIGNNIPYFQSSLMLNLTRYDFDPDNLAAASIYDFVFWSLTGKKSDIKKCFEINQAVNDLKHKCLFKLNSKY